MNVKELSPVHAAVAVQGFKPSLQTYNGAYEGNWIATLTDPFRGDSAVRTDLGPR